MILAGDRLVVDRIRTVVRRLDRDQSPPGEPLGEEDRFRARPHAGTEYPRVGPQLRQDSPSEQMQGFTQRGDLRPLLVLARGALLAEGRPQFLSFHAASG